MRALLTGAFLFRAMGAVASALKEEAIGFSYLGRPPGFNNWVAGKKYILNYHNPETLVFTIDLYDGSLKEFLNSNPENDRCWVWLSFGSGPWQLEAR